MHTTATEALILSDDGTLLNGRWNTYPTCRQHLSGDKYHPNGHRSVAVFDSDSNVLF